MRWLSIVLLLTILLTVGCTNGDEEEMEDFPALSLPRPKEGPPKWTIFEAGAVVENWLWDHANSIRLREQLRNVLCQAEDYGLGTWTVECTDIALEPEEGWGELGEGMFPEGSIADSLRSEHGLGPLPTDGQFLFFAFEQSGAISSGNDLADYLLDRLASSRPEPISTAPISSSSPNTSGPRPLPTLPTLPRAPGAR